MNARRPGLRPAFQVGGVMLLLIATFPVLAIAAFFLRGVVFGAAVLAVLAGFTAYAASPRFRAWLALAESDAVVYKGLRLPTDVALTPAHVWARVDGGEATVGIDDLAQAVLGPAEIAELPRVGTRVAAGDPIFALRRGFRAIVARSPVAGKVTAVNAALRGQPGRVNESPFGKGWAVRLEGSGMRRQTRQLLRGLAGGEWFRQEVDRLLLTMAASDPAPTLPDGGVLCSDLYRHLDDAMWARVESSFLGSARALAGAPRTDLIV